MSVHSVGVRKVEATRDQDGHRSYKVVYRVQTDRGDGPATIWASNLMPSLGSTYQVGSDFDLWAWCRADSTITKVSEVRDGEQPTVWDVSALFSTKPQDPDKQRCMDNPVQDPLSEPFKVSGKFVKYQKEAAFDRFGAAIVNSAWEPFTGPQVEFDEHRGSVRIEMNVSQLNLELLNALTDNVNDAPMWGCPYRSIKLSQPGWDRKFYGTCSIYYTWTLEFDVFVVTNPDTDAYESGHDRTLLDKGTKVLNGHWGSGSNPAWILDNIGGDRPDPNNPTHFIQCPDRNGNPMKVVILNGHGLPSGVGIGTGTGSLPTEPPGQIRVQKYDENNLFLLGIPSVL